ncbi:MAG: hypothetical protein SPL02_02315 [Bacilli bacterium]|nr:hypothetical protein [Bacilli bacterium]MDY6430169.1 hypothetical protein [Bacilli bacterium]
MANYTKPTKKFVCGIFYYGDHILLCRELKANGLPKSGFHFPGGEIKPGFDPVIAIQRNLAIKYKAHAKVISELTPLKVSYPTLDIVLIPFYLEDSRQFVYPKHIEHKYFHFKEIDDVYIDACDRFLVEKAVYYESLIRNKKPTKSCGLSKAEINYFRLALRYFKKRLPQAEINDFESLLHTEINRERATKAFRWLLKTFGCDYNEYLDQLTYLQKAERR